MTLFKIRLGGPRPLRLAGRRRSRRPGLCARRRRRSSPRPTLIPDNLNGNASVQSSFVNPAQISGTPGYVKAVPITGFSFLFGNAQSYLLLNPAGTLAAGAATTAVNPSDGQRECLRSTQAVTAFTADGEPGPDHQRRPDDADGRHVDLLHVLPGQRDLGSELTRHGARR